MYRHVKYDERTKQEQARTERKAHHLKICSNERSKPNNKGIEASLKTPKRGSEIARGQGTQQEDTRNRNTRISNCRHEWYQMARRAEKNLQLLVKNCSLSRLDVLNNQSLRNLILHSSKLLERAKDKMFRAR